MLLRLTAVWVRSALPKAGKIINRRNCFLCEVDSPIKAVARNWTSGTQEKIKILLDCLQRMECLECLSLINIEISKPFYRFWDLFAIGAVGPCSSKLLKSVFISHSVLVNQAHRHGISQNRTYKEPDLLQSPESEFI